MGAELAPVVTSQGWWATAESDSASDVERWINSRPHSWQRKSSVVDLLQALSHASAPRAATTPVLNDACSR
jgi:hypothetical protein